MAAGFVDDLADGVDNVPQPVRCTIISHEEAHSGEDVLFDHSLTSVARLAHGVIAKVELVDGKELGSEVPTSANYTGEGIRGSPLLFVVRGPRKGVPLGNEKSQLSVPSKIAQYFHLRRGAEVEVTQVDSDEHTATHVELSFRDVYLTRADMRRIIIKSVKDRVLYSGQQITYLGSVKLTVKNIFIDGRQRRCAYFSSNTKPIFRSESSRFIIYIQMSEEMWNFHTDGSGDIAFDKVVNGVLPDLFHRWSLMKAHHLVSVVFFTRVEQHGVEHEDSPIDGAGDFFRVVVAEMSSGEWSEIIRQLKHAFRYFLHDITLVHARNPSPTDASSEERPAGDRSSPVQSRPTSARNGNVLEAINIVSSAFSQDFLDTDLVRTGLAILIITPSAGVFDVDEDMLHLTTENLVNNSINIDLLCLRRPPLHAAPLFRYLPQHTSLTEVNSIAIQGGLSTHPTSPSASLSTRNESGHHEGNHTEQSSTSGARYPQDRIAVIPHWIHVHFWHGDQDSLAVAEHKTDHALRSHHKHTATRACNMVDVQMNGVMESETCLVSTAIVNQQNNHHENAIQHVVPSLASTLQNSHNVSTRNGENKSPTQSDRDMGQLYLDRYDSHLFSNSTTTNQLESVTLRSKSSMQGVEHRSLPKKRAGVHSSKSPTLSRSPGSTNTRSASEQGHKAKRSSVSRTSEATMYGNMSATVRPQRLERQYSTTSSLASGFHDKVSLMSTSRGLSLGKAPATVSQPVVDAVPASTAGPIPDGKTTKETDRLGPESSRTPELVPGAERQSMQGPVHVSPPADSYHTMSAADVPAFRAARQESKPAQSASPMSGPSHVTRPGHGDDRSRRSSSATLPYTSNAREPAGMSFALGQWLIKTNPARPNDMQFISHGWTNAFTHPMQALTLETKWTSLCSPAAFPLSSDYLVRREMLAYYEERSHRVAIEDDEDRPLIESRTHMLGQLIAFRLAKGFQMVRGPSSPEGFSAFEETVLGEEGRSFYLMKGNTVHVLLTTDIDVQVNMYQPRASLNQTVHMKKIYRPLVKSTLEPTYERIAAPLSLARDEHNWSTIDNYIAGHLDKFSLATGFWRSRFSLVPVEPNRQTRKAGDTDDELRVEGILRLSQLWHKARVIKGDPIISTAGQDRNPLGIEFQTRDISAVLSAGLEDSHQTQGHSVVRSTQLFDEDDHSSPDQIDLQRLAEALQSPEGIPIRDRGWYIRYHRSAFVGLDLTTWLMRNLPDINSREEAEQAGDKLMRMGLFKHVNSKHAFRDGNYFYVFEGQYQVTKKNKPVKPNHASPLNISADPTSQATSSDASPSITKADAPETLEPVLEPKRPKVDLTVKLRCDIDTRNKSDRREVVNLHYDRVCNPEACYHLRLEWMSTTEKLVEEAITSWATTAERYGWRLVQVPITEACKIAQVNPFRTPTIIVFAVRPPDQEPDLSHVDSAAPETLPTHRYHPYQRALLKRFGFVMDIEAAVNMPADIERRYSYANVDYQYSQYIHRTGTLMAQIDIDGRLLIVANRLANNRSSFARDAAARMEKREQGRVISGNTASGLGASALGQAQAFGSARSSPASRPVDTLSPGPVAQAQETAESVKEGLQAFCASSEALLAFYDEVIRKDPLLSPRSTPAMGPRQGWSTRSTPMLHATIPSLELPPVFSGISQLLSEQHTAASGLPRTPAKELQDAYKGKE